MLYEVTPLTRSPPRVVPLPIMVDPMEGEALISWCHRLGARLGFRPRETAHMLSVDTSDPTWWQRPRPETLLSISRRTGVSTKRVQAMTLLDWKGLSSQITVGQIVGRGTRDLHRPGRSSQFCVVCPQCLVDDREAWFRLDWLTGWATVCPTHGTVFIEICGECRFPVRMPTLTVQDTPTLGTCPNCGARYCDAPSTNAHPAVVALQEPMFRAMRDGEARFPGLQSCAWSTMAAFVAQLSRTIWDVREGRPRYVLFVRIAEDLSMPPTTSGSWGRAYDLMLIAAWMLQKPLERWSIILGITSNMRNALEVVMRLPVRQRTRLLNIFSVDGIARKKAYVETRSIFCRRDYYPDVDTLQQHAALARNEAIYRKMLAIARCREGESVQAIVDESGYPHYVVRRWLLKYKPDQDKTQRASNLLHPPISKSVRG